MNIWKLFNEMETLQNELQKVSKGIGLGGLPRLSFLSGLTSQVFPVMNIKEEDDKILVEALVPGVEPKNLNVSMTRDTLTISGEKPELKVKVEAFHRNERGAGKFLRTVELPCHVDSTKVAAEYKNGILLVTIPKAEEAKPKSVEIKIA